MKLATYRDGSRDGQLVVVSRDLALAHYAGSIASRLQQVLDDWNFLSPQLEDLSATLNTGKARHAFAFDPARCLAPLPRAYQWVLPAGGTILQHASDTLLAAHDSQAFEPARPGALLHAGFAIVTGDLPRHATPAQALERVRLVLLAHVWGVAQGPCPPGAFAPVAVTPEELGAGWHDGRVRLALRSRIEGPGAIDGHAPAPGAIDDPAPSPCADFADVLSRLARVRPVPAGSIIGPQLPAAASLPAEPGRRGEDAACAQTGWAPGSTAHTEAIGADGLSVFGAISQRLVLEPDAQAPA